jgi:hypothetical protein
LAFFSALGSFVGLAGSSPAILMAPGGGFLLFSSASGALSLSFSLSAAAAATHTASSSSAAAHGRARRAMVLCVLLL